MTGGSDRTNGTWLRVVSPSVSSGIPSALIGIGALIALSAIGSPLLFHGPAGLSDPGSLFSLVLNLGFGSAIAGGGYWLERSGLDEARYRRVFVWAIGGLGGFLMLNLGMMYFFPAGGLANHVGWGLFAAGFGGASGFLVGAIEARAIERALDAERASIRAATAESQRQWLNYLNSLLRHEVLNDANVIEGYASILLDEYDDEDARDRLETILARSRDMTDVITDVRELLEAAEESSSLESTNLVSVIRDELTALEQSHGAANVETKLDVQDEPYVMADDLLPRVFSNLLSNAVEHADDPAPRVLVTITSDGDTASVRIADDGPGIPPEERETLFERSPDDDHGMGLFLVRMLVTRYDGDVELTRTGPRGTVFTVELPTTASPERSDVRAATDLLVASATPD